MTERERFEKICIDYGYDINCYIVPDDLYVNLETRAGWFFWQARAEEISGLKEKIRILSDQGGHVAWERDDLKKEIAKLKNALSCAKDVIDGEMAGQDYPVAMTIINKALEEKS